MNAWWLECERRIECERNGSLDMKGMIGCEKKLGCKRFRCDRQSGELGCECEVGSPKVALGKGHTLKAEQPWLKSFSFISF